ncbi:MAG: DUF3365 domain-containing protein [Pirellulaceae bacterium]
MKRLPWVLTCVVVAATLWFAIDRSTNADQPLRAESTTRIKAEHRLSVDAARQRGQMMHAIYASTLDVMHHRYFHGGRSIVPARAMEDIFDDIKDRTSIETRWISVNLKPMSIHHKPVTDFEKLAAEKIATGESEVETIEDGFYRRAGAIAMDSGCISCHDGFFKKQNDQPKFAGLIISIPVELDRKPAHGE